MRLLPLALLAGIIGLGLILSPTLLFGNYQFYSASTNAGFQGNTTTGNDSSKITSSVTFAEMDRLGLSSSPYGFLIGPLLIVVIGSAISLTAFLIMKKFHARERI